METYTVGQFAMVRQPSLLVKDGGVVELSEILDRFGFTSAALVTGASSLRRQDVWPRILENLSRNKKRYLLFSVESEPSPSIVDGIAAAMRSAEVTPEVVVAIGGGSVMDAAKAAAAAFTMEGSIRDYIEGVGSRTPDGSTLPVIAVPTTAGTGSEATKNAVLSESGSKLFKKSLRHDNYVPVSALLDATLHLSCPPGVTRAAGLDAITQLIEAYVSTGASPGTDMVVSRGLSLAAHAFPRVLENGRDIKARREMAYAAYLSGVALANAGLGVVHGLAAPLGALHAIPHGVACGLLLPGATRFELDQGTSREKYDDAARHFNVSGTRFPELLAEWASPLPRLRSFGFSEFDLERAADMGSNKSQPTPLSREEMVNLMRGVL